MEKLQPLPNKSVARRPLALEPPVAGCPKARVCDASHVQLLSQTLRRT